ncbi:MAG: hypothetical protein K1V80_04015 [Muribaculaceae bacterium]
MKLKYFLLPLVAALMVGCSDEPENAVKIDDDLIKTLSRDGSVSTYVMTWDQSYVKDTVAGSEWKVWDDSELIGGSGGPSSVLCFQDGCLWEPVRKKLTTGEPARPYMVWSAYCKFSKIDDQKKFYVKNKFVYDEREKTMRIGNSRPYNVEEFNGHTLKFNLEYRHGYWKDLFNTDYSTNEYVVLEYRKDVYEYKIAEPVRFDGEDVMAFDSNAECYRYWVKQYRDKYGQYLNLNEYYGGTAFLENPIMDMDEVEKWIDEFEKSEN